MTLGTIIELVLLAWVGLSMVLGVALGRAFAQGQTYEVTAAGRPAASRAPRP